MHVGRQIMNTHATCLCLVASLLLLGCGAPKHNVDTRNNVVLTAKVTEYMPGAMWTTYIDRCQPSDAITFQISSPEKWRGKALRLFHDNWGDNPFCTYGKVYRFSVSAEFLKEYFDSGRRKGQGTQYFTGSIDGEIESVEE